MKFEIDKVKNETQETEHGLEIVLSYDLGDGNEVIVAGRGNNINKALLIPRLSKTVEAYNMV